MDPASETRSGVRSTEGGDATKWMVTVLFDADDAELDYELPSLWKHFEHTFHPQASSFSKIWASKSDAEFT